MIKIELKAFTNQEPTNLISHAAKTCYTSTLPEMGQTIDVKSNLFNTGHHTTLQHSFFTFAIDGLSVNSVTFGLHLAAPFYNTDQRSGRFSKMYKEPNFEDMEEYIKHLWKDVTTKQIENIISWIKMGTDIYHNNIEKATELAAEEIKKERPHANEKYISRNAPKFAQEQLRNFITTLSPTGFDYTINLSALTALYRSAWSPEMKFAVNKMVKEVLNKYPDLEYMFEEDSKLDKTWVPEISSEKISLKEKPELKLIKEKSHLPDEINFTTGKDAVDLAYFRPENMDYNTEQITTNVKTSIATFGQDQRHRTVKRSAPKITGEFYMPPLVKKLGLEKDAISFMDKYFELKKDIPATLHTALLPYGAMVEYQKSADLNSLKHEQAKRTCWCAQEEIYHLSTALRAEVSKYFGKDHPLLEYLAPACYKGKCIEGSRYCGRSLLKEAKKNFFLDRQI